MEHTTKSAEVKKPSFWLLPEDENQCSRVVWPFHLEGHKSNGKVFALRAGKTYLLKNSVKIHVEALILSCGPTETAYSAIQWKEELSRRTCSTSIHQFLYNYGEILPASAISKKH
jgi:hypothetical protein